jgi:CheY-like chemotaxis protein
MSLTVKLLAVDDTPSSLEILSESLRQEGLAIFTSTNPEDWSWSTGSILK